MQNAKIKNQNDNVKMEKSFLENIIEKPKWKRLPVTVDVNGIKENVWVNYIVELKDIEGICVECGAENQVMPCESVKEIKVESEDVDIVQQATEKITELVRRHEQKMFVCKNCLNDDFVAKRKELYVRTLEEVQGELGIEVDEDAQRKNILNSD